MPRRIAIELDGVLADGEGDLVSQAGFIEKFWESLHEIEPGIVARLASVAAQRRWEIIFLAQRAPSAGTTVQLQAQRWLESKGFALPSMYVVQGSRGKIAAALGLDLVIDGSPEHCVDVVEDSDARAILVWRGDRDALPVEARRPEIKIVKSAGECFDMLTALAEPSPRESGFFARLRRVLGLKEAKQA